MTILESTREVRWFFQILSLTQLQSSVSNTSLFKSRLLLVYSITVAIISFLVFFHGVFLTNGYKITEQFTDIGNTVDFIQLTSIRLAHLVAILESLFSCNAQRRFFEKIQQIDVIFEKCLGEKSCNLKFKTSICRYGLGMLCMYLGTELFVMGAMIGSGESGKIGKFWLSYLVPFIVTGIRYFQIFICIGIIQKRANKLNFCLSGINLFIEKNLSGSLLLNYPEIKISDKYDRYIYNLKGRLNRTAVRTEGPGYAKLLIIRDIYNQLWEVNLLVNQCFGFSILVNVGNDFLSITSNCYWIFLSLKQDTITYQDFFTILGSAVWSVPHFFNVVVLAILCHQTVNSANRIALNLHKIEIDMGDEIHNTFIEQFSLQLLHQKIFFTACGFFNVDCSLLYTIAGATTTYLIILIQFHLGAEKSISTTTTLPLISSTSSSINHA